jgi:hypothetical protein
MSDKRKNMKTLPCLLALSTLLAGCASGPEWAAAEPDTAEKYEITGSRIPRKKPQEVEVVNKEGFQ